MKNITQMQPLRPDSYEKLDKVSSYLASLFIFLHATYVLFVCFYLSMMIIYTYNV